MSNISITGNEAQFNEKVTFLKDVDIKGTLLVPDQELTLTKLTTPLIVGNPQLTINGETTFTDTVNFQDALSFPDLEIRDRLQVGSGGTVLTIDTSFNPGKVGIASTQPTELLDVFGKAKIKDLELENLLVTGISTFQGKIFTGVGATVGLSTHVYFKDRVEAVFGDDLRIYSYNNDGYIDSGLSSDINLRSIGTQSKISLRYGLGAFGEIGDEVLANFIPNSKVELFYNGLSKFETTGVGASVLGEFVVDNDGSRLGRVGIGTTSITPVGGLSNLNDGANGVLRLVADGSISVARNIYDSAGSPGQNGYFMNRDANGIRWVSFEPSFTEGIFIQDEGTYVPTVGVAQSFTILNFVQSNSLGLGTDTLIPTAQNDTTQTGFSTIFTKDLWGYSGTGDNAEIYRMTNVGIGTNNPAFPSGSGLEIHDSANPRLKLSNTASGVGDADGTQLYLASDGTTILDNKDGQAIRVDTNASQRLGITPTGEVNIGGDYNQTTKKFKVTGVAEIDGNLDVTTNLDVDGHTELDNVNISGISTFVGNAEFNARVEMKGDTNIGDSPSDSLLVSAGSTFNAGINVNQHTELDDVNVTGVTTFNNDVQFIGNSSNITFDKVNSSLDFSDNSTAVFGDNGDLTVKHNNSTTNTEVTNINGNLEVSTNQLQIKSVNGSKSYLEASLGYGVTLFTDNSKKLETNSLGIDVTGLTDTDTLNVSTTSTFSGNIDANSNLDVQGNAGIGSLNVVGVSTFIGISTFKEEVGIAKTLNLGSHIKDINNSVASGKTDYRLSSVGTGVSWRPSGVQTKRTIWVSKNGNDSNSGLLEGDAKATIGGAAAVAIETDTIKVRPGIYVENNPIGLRTDVTVTGEDLRLVIIQSQNPTKDVFHVRRGCLVENLNFGGSNVGVSHQGGACVAFPTPSGSNSAVSGYTEPGPATEGPSGRWRSPYVRNCTNFMTASVGMRIDGNDATASTVGADLKSMVCDSFTQYNEAGIGVSLTNDAYAQLVSIFTINTDIGIYAATGAQCDLTNSNSSFGNFGLVAAGLGSTTFTGIVSNTNTAGDIITSTNAEEQDTVVAVGLTDFSNTVRRPFDGQALYFKIDLDNYPDTPGGGRITAPLQQLASVKLISPNLSGFSAIDPPNVLIRDFDGSQEPKGPQGIIAEATASVSASGVLTEINVVAQGRNYLPTQNIIVDIEGNTGLATAVMSPIYYTVESATNPVPVSGITTITFNEFIPYEIFADDPFTLQRISRILTSSHSFEYVGTGTDINISTPLQGAIPIKANEVVATDGAQIPFTSTDQKGNFDIGEGLQINQTTSTISGRDFSRSLQAEVTPLILALR
tara:strand:- start:718 stop:4704 length:3987 start_codon:yes stop_codon:yes gene_type:complete